MKKNTLAPDLDLLCKTLCKRVLDLPTYQNLSSVEINKLSTFLIQFNPDFSSSRESLNKNLQNWFMGKNSPSQAKIEEIAKSLKYKSHQDFIQQNKQKIKVARLQQSISFDPFQKVLLLCSLALLISLFSPFFTGGFAKEVSLDQAKSSTLLASVIQAIVVVLFYILTRFSDFGGRTQIYQPVTKRPLEVSRSLEQFFKSWQYLWLSFSFLYLWFCVLYGTKIPENSFTQSISDVFLILSSLCFAYLFSVMDVQSIPRKQTSGSIGPFYTYLIIFTVGLSISSMLSILDRYYNLGILDGLGAYILGYANVIVMLYFFGRLESHFLNVNRFVLLPLYTYAIIQIAYVLLTKTGGQTLAPYILGMVLILKGFLYFLIREWIKEGKMEGYFLKQHQKILEA